MICFSWFLLFLAGVCCRIYQGLSRLGDRTILQAADLKFKVTWIGFWFNIPGVTFGGRYDGSPVIPGDGSAIPADDANTYIPSAKPGGRPPHAWLPDGRSLYDTFGPEWTLLVLQADPAAVATWQAAAQRMGVSLTVVQPELDGLSELYQAPLALIRPDQIVAWRGTAGADPAPIWCQLLGHNA